MIRKAGVEENAKEYSVKI